MAHIMSLRQNKAFSTAQFLDPHRVEEAAYYKWLNRGHVGDNPMEDWLEAELELQSNLYSEDDEVENRLASIARFGLPSLEDRRRADRPAPCSRLLDERYDLDVPNSNNENGDTSTSRSTSNQATMASQQAET